MVIGLVRTRFAPGVACWVAESEGKPVAANGSFVQEMPATAWEAVRERLEQKCRN